MSTRYEWVDASHVFVDYVQPGHSVDDGAEVIGAPGVIFEGVTESGAVVLGYDEAFVIDGGPDAIRALCARILAALPDVEVPA